MPTWICALSLPTIGFSSISGKVFIQTLAGPDERVAEALSVGQWYASRNCSYITTCAEELLDRLGVRGIVERPMRPVEEECRA